MSQYTTDSGLVIEDLTVGSGAVVCTGQTVLVHYTGCLSDGTKFDSSKDRDDPLSFSLGCHYVIAGLEEGLLGMQVGSTRRLTIPPQLGYGSGGAGDVIPPNATLIFEVELLEIG
ncbi:MAG: FKBP-type peptidyl-prolyl cis-trans isomerase [Sterolibacterium sp.]